MQGSGAYGGNLNRSSAVTPTPYWSWCLKGSWVAVSIIALYMYFNWGKQYLEVSGFALS